jgi:squalene synthase HpnC
MALYGWARLVDELGDDYAGDRLAALSEVERQLRSALADQTAAGQSAAGQSAAGQTGEADLHPLVAAMAESARRLRLPSEPLFDLVQANRQDQAVKRYKTFDDLVGYCRLSANPVGRTVLSIFGVSTDERAALSDSICTALQLVEHWQDVAEDAIVGRVYLPLEDVERFGVTTDELVPPPTSYRELSRGPGRAVPRGSSAGVRALLAFESARARRMLDEGAPLVASLQGRLRLAVAGFVAGGYAALDALAANDFDIFADQARPRTARFLNHFGHLVATPCGRAQRSRPPALGGKS